MSGVASAEQQNAVETRFVTQKPHRKRKKMRETGPEIDEMTHDDSNLVLEKLDQPTRRTYQFEHFDIEFPMVVALKNLCDEIHDALRSIQQRLDRIEENRANKSV